MSKRWLFAAVALLWAAPAFSQGVELESKALRLKFSGRVQVQAGTTTCDEFPVPSNSACGEQVAGVDLRLRRARFTVEAQINDNIDLKIQPDYSAITKIGLKDAWGRYTWSKAARLKAGNFKRPFGGFTLVSSTQILTIERVLAVRGLPDLIAPSYSSFTLAFNLSDRDVGVQLDGTTNNGLFSYWAGVFTGASELNNRDTNTEKQYIGRGQINLTSVLSMPLKIAVAAAASDQGFELPTTEKKTKYFYDYEIFADWGTFGGGAHVQAGFVLGDNPLQASAGGAIDLPAGDEFASMRSWQVIGAWKFPIGSGTMALEPLFRVSWADGNTNLADNTVWGFTPGIQIFFYGRNKLAVNWDVVVPTSTSLRSEHSLKAQWQFHF
jgi:hypothetical protein